MTQAKSAEPSLGEYIATIGMLRRDVADDIASALLTDLTSPLKPLLCGWNFNLDDAPENEPVILAAIGPNEWIVGEAVRREWEGSSIWWWADAPEGDYDSDDVVNMGQTPTCWMPLPAPPTSNGGDHG